MTTSPDSDAPNRSADATRLRRVNQAVRESEQRFRVFASATSDVVYRMSPDWSEMRYLAGRDFIPDTLEPSASWLAKYILPEDRAQFTAAVDEALRSKSVFELEHRVIRTDGSIGWTHSRAIPILDDDGIIVEWFGAASDISRRKEAESSLRMSEDKFRMLFDSIDVGFCIIEVLFDEAGKPFDYRFLEANPAFVSQTMLEGAIGKTIREFAPRHEQFWFDVYGDIARTGTAARFEHQAEGLPEYRWYEVYAFRIGEPGENKVAVLFRDIADRKRREWSAKFLAEVTEDFNRLTGPDEIVQALGERLEGFLHATGLTFSELDEHSGEVMVRHAWTAVEVPPVTGQHLRVEDFVLEEADRDKFARETFVVADSFNDKRFHGDNHRAIGIGSYVTVPQHRGERVTAYMSVMCAEPRAWPPQEIELLEELAARMFPRIERARAEVALRESEAKYRSLFESIDEGFCIIEVVLDDHEQVVDVIYREVNEAFERQSGVPQDVVGKHATEVFQRLSQERRDIFTRVYKTGESVHIENYSAETDRWYSLHYARIGASGSLLQSIVFEDISERRARERQKEYLLKLSDALRSLADPVAIETTALRLLGEHLGADRVFYATLDATHEHFTVEREYSRGNSPPILGTYRMSAYKWAVPAYERGEAIVVDDAVQSRVIAPEDVPAMEAIHIRSFISAPLFRNDALLHTLTVSDDSARMWKVDDVELVRETLERTSAALERSIADDARRESEAQLREANRRKDEFLAMLAHELRNPLAPLRTGLELIRVSGSTPKAVESVRSMMERQVGHMVRLIDDLLDVSRITSGKIQLQRAPTLLSDIVCNAVEANRAAIDAAGIELAVALPDSPVILDADRTRLVQVLSNLLHNAVKFTKAPGRVEIDARVTIPETPQSEGTLSLSVTDNGVGIAKEFLPHIFDLFMQGEQKIGGGLPGLGIGLALAKHLVEMHGGRIDGVSDGVDRGSRFIIELPIPREVAPASASTANAPTMRVSQRILVVDDNRDAALSMSMLLQALGGETRIAHDGREGIRAVTEFRPDVVLLDIGMPGMDGYEAVGLIRAEPVGRDALIVAVTGWGQEQDKKRAFDAGFDAHITKPADLGSLEKLLSDSGSSPRRKSKRYP